LDPAEITEAASRACGWLEEAPGVKSSTRLFAAILLALAAAIVGLIVWYVMTHPAPDAGVVGALAGVLTALVLQGAVAITRRTG